MAQPAHHYAQRDVDDVVAGAPAVREAREIAARHAEGALLSGRRRRERSVLSRCISEAVTFDCWFKPWKPVRNAVTRSVRGRFDGARFGMFVPSVAFTASRNSTSSSAGSVGLVT